VSRRALIASLLLALGAIAAPQAPPAAEARWDAKLQALHPTRPSAYFELAEDIADAAASDEERGLARRLFALAGALDPERLGRSACLALADMQSQPHLRRRLLALATLLGERRGEIAALDVLEQTAAPSADAALAVVAAAKASARPRCSSGRRRWISWRSTTSTCPAGSTASSRTAGSTAAGACARSSVTTS
jgi:hypothetical protein